MSLRRCSLVLALVGCGGGSHAAVAPEGDASEEVGAVDVGGGDVGGGEVGGEVGGDAGADAPASDAPAEAGDVADVAGPTLRVLFVGNSYVFTNDLPKMLRELSTGAPAIETAEVLVGGATLENHWTTGTAPARIDDKTWTHVVLQGQSVEPLWQPAVFQSYAKKFGERIVAAGARPTWFVTWARGEGDATYAEAWSGGTPAGMQDALTAAYEKAAASFATSVLARAGEAFRKVRAERPSLALQVDDKSHPTVAGTYLAACTFYLALVGKPAPPSGKVPAGLDAADATYLCAVPSRL